MQDLHFKLCCLFRLAKFIHFMLSVYSTFLEYHWNLSSSVFETARLSEHNPLFQNIKSISTEGRCQEIIYRVLPAPGTFLKCHQSDVIGFEVSRIFKEHLLITSSSAPDGLPTASFDNKWNFTHKIQRKLIMFCVLIT